MHQDPLIIVNSKTPCPNCLSQKPAIKHCKTCNKLGFLKTNIQGLWSSPGFLVCGGPSINSLPYNKLNDRGIVSLAINNIAAHVPVNAWVFSDPQEKFHHALFLDPKIITFAPISKLTKHYRIKENNQFTWSTNKVKDCPNTFGFSRQTLLYPESFLKTDYAMWGYGGKQKEKEANTSFICLSTMLLGIRLMSYLGCNKIYLLGVDFFRAPEQQYAFSQKANPSNSRYIHENFMLKQIKPYLEQENIHIYNCNKESKCDVFDYVDFNTAYEDCKGLVREPFDLSGWYEKNEKEKDQK